MNRQHLFSLILIFLALLSPLQTQANGKAWVLDIKGAIGPATADYLKRGLENARNQGVTIVVLRMDTPGG